DLGARTHSLGTQVAADLQRIEITAQDGGDDGPGNDSRLRDADDKIRPVSGRRYFDCKYTTQLTEELPGHLEDIGLRHAGGALDEIAGRRHPALLRRGNGAGNNSGLARAGQLPGVQEARRMVSCSRNPASGENRS